MNSRTLITIVFLAMFVAICSTATAQNAPAGAVQLPTFGYNTATTTVSVPDRGGVYMGGVRRSSSGRTETGVPLLPFNNRSIGNQTSATSFSVHAYVHDFEAMDAAALNAGGGTAAGANGSGNPVIVNGNRTIPFRYSSTQPQPQPQQVNPNRVAVRKRTRSSNSNDEPLVMTGSRSNNNAALGNVRDPLE